MGKNSPLSSPRRQLSPTCTRFPPPEKPVEDILTAVPHPEKAPAAWFSPLHALRDTVAVPPTQLQSGATMDEVLHRVIHNPEFLRTWYADRGDTDLDVPHWPAVASGARLLTATITVYAPLRTATQLVQGQRFAVGLRGDATVLVWHLTSQTPGVTYGTTFRSEILLEFVQPKGQLVTLTTYMQCTFVSSTWMASMIRSRCATEVADNMKLFVDKILKIAKPPPRLPLRMSPQLDPATVDSSAPSVEKLPEANAESTSIVAGPTSDLFATVPLCPVEMTQNASFVQEVAHGDVGVPDEKTLLTRSVHGMPPPTTQQIVVSNIHLAVMHHKGIQLFLLFGLVGNLHLLYELVMDPMTLGLVAWIRSLVVVLALPIAVTAFLFRSR